MLAAKALVRQSICSASLVQFKQYFISEFTSIIQYIQMYSGTGFDSKPKLLFKSFPITMWIIQIYMRMALAINVH